jgi:hypothetical protein
MGWGGEGKEGRGGEGWEKGWGEVLLHGCWGGMDATVYALFSARSRGFRLVGILLFAVNDTTRHVDMY